MRSRPSVSIVRPLNDCQAPELRYASPGSWSSIGDYAEVFVDDHSMLPRAHSRRYKAA